MPNVRVVSFLGGQRLFTLGAAIVCMMVGASVLASWRFDQTLLPNAINGQPTMPAMTALCFVMGGLSLLLFQVSAVRRATLSRAACGLAVALTILAGVTLSQDLLGSGASIGDSVQQAVSRNAEEPSGLMSGAAALVFILVGSAMILMLRHGRVLWLGQSLAASAFLISLLSLLAYLFGADVDRVIPFSSMTALTASVFLVLGAGVLTLRGTQGWISEFFQDTPSARAGRLYLVSTIVALPLIAQLRIIGERDLDWYDTYFGVAILTVGSIAVLSMLNWMAVRLGNANDRQIDRMLRVNRTLSGINTLIVRVREKEELFRESCRIAVESGRFPWAWIATVAPQSSRLELQACHGGDETLREDLDGWLGGDGEVAGDGLLQQVLRSAEPMNLASLTLHRTSSLRERRSLGVLREAGMRSMVVLPLLDTGRVAGLLALYSEHAGFFDSMEMHLLNELAGDIGFAIGHIEKDATLNYLAYYDPLTGMPNRTLFMERLGRELHMAARQDGVVALVIGNLQRFRMVNETFGRHVGDDLLRELATRLSRTSPFPENLSRINADSFACFMPGADVQAMGHHVQSMFEGSLAQPFIFGEQAVTVEVTVAASVFPFDGADGETLMINAETALRKAKATRAPFMFYESGMNARVAETLKLEHRLRDALEQGQLELHYQPKVDFGDRQVHSVEALMRWRDPQRGLIPPGLFIPLMEEIGLIRQAGAWALRQAVHDLERWRALGLRVPRCAVNVSPIQLRHDDFVATVVHAIADFGAHAPLLDIEITESLLMQDVAQTSKVLHILQDAGVQVAVDDFGTGYSSLAYLARLPINALKIDRAFVMEMEQSAQNVAIVGSIISLAHSLKLEVIAEGVETEAQAAILRRLQCDLMQGYLFSKPVPFDDLAMMLPNAATSAAGAEAV